MMMALPHSTLTTIPVSFATCSIGRPTTSLPSKLSALHAAGFRAIELSMPDLTNHATSLSNDGNEVTDHDWPALLSAARDVRRLCDGLGFEVMLMQPFANFEGWAEGSAERADAFERAENWLRIMEVVGCRTLQVGSTDTPVEKVDLSRAKVVGDLRILAGMLEEKGMRLAYENWCWSSHAPGWREVWEIVREVDRGNVGLCLDTFQTAGGEWGDPTTASGLVEEEGREERFRRSMEELAREVPKEKIYLLQISDAYRMETPLEAKEVDGLRPRGRWSHDYRPLPFEGYLPTVEVAKAVLKTGFRSWFSYEVFDTPPWKKAEEVNDLEGFAKKAIACQERFIKACAED